jgi:hypothetical protein
MDVSAERQIDPGSTKQDWGVSDGRVRSSTTQEKVLGLGKFAKKEPL